jgi:hypothetical protein
MNAAVEIGVTKPMSLEDFIRILSLPPIVPIKRACEVQACGHSHLYELRKKGKLRIVPRTAGTGVPVTDLYRLYLEAVSQ